MSARLTHPSIAAGGRPIRFWYDGQPVDGLEGETVAAALAANHLRQMRHTRGGGHAACIAAWVPASTAS